MMVVFPDGKQVQGKVLGANYSKDIAMVKIEDKGEWPHVTLGGSKDLAAGDWVVTLGHSAGFDPARTAFIDDNPAVLAAARKAGIGLVIAVTHADSSRSPRLPPAGFPEAASVADIL